MAGIYIHIPFCKKACHYCNFHFSTSIALKNGFLKALLNEIRLQSIYLNGQTIFSIYLGGGTPSLLSINECKEIFDTLSGYFNIDPRTEITLEANPDDIEELKLIGWKEIGINRLSIGVQSFHQKELTWMNRAHDAGQARKSIQLALTHFSNLTVDLIYGVPGLLDHEWEENVRTLIDAGIPHLSCYALTVEPKTALQKMIDLQKLPNVNLDDQARQFLLLVDWLEAAGYEQYEISNFALPGKRSLHNSSYWKGEHYLGLGPSAHSFNGSSRQWNIANNAMYIQSLEKNELPFEKEDLTPTQQHNEYVMTALRTMEGIDLSVIDQRFGKLARQNLLIKVKEPGSKGLLRVIDEKIQLTKQGRLFADGLAADFFSDGD
jgi:oxygen-independent coproporphyrinogen III oxidase